MARPATEASGPAAETPQALPEDADFARSLAEAERLWRDRNEPEALAGAIATWESMTRRWPDQVAPYLMLARASRVQAQMRTGAAAVDAYARGARAGAAAAKLSQGDQALRASYWWLVNRVDAARYGAYVDYVDGYQDMLATARELIARGCVEDHGGPERVLATLLAAPPVYEARELARARELFEALVVRNPRHLEGRIAYAREYAVAVQDLGLFKAQLRQVLAATAGSVDDKLAQAAAEQLLLRAPALFE